jgi:uncharacterized protein YdeI (YjbR/CyaY-like superfamily)
VIKTENFSKVEVTSTKELRGWLSKNHTQQESVWLVTYKKHTGDKYVSVQEVLDELLCVGWIDGIRRKLDDGRTMQLVGPRRVHHWAKSYKDRAEKLIKEKRMQPAGLAMIAESKKRGLWTVLEDVDALELPEDFVTALEAHPPAPKNFGAFPDSVKRFALRYIKLAQSPEARARRIKKTAQLAAQNKKVPGS